MKGLEKRSQHSYTEWVINLAHFYQTCDLPSLEPVKVLDYLIYLKDDRRYAAGTLNQALNGLRGLYRDHLDFEWDIWRKIKIKRVEPLPHVLNKPSVLLLLQTFTEHDLKMYFTLVYRTGMRLNEARNLKAAHIDGDRKVIRVIKAKSGRQRDIPISDNTYLLLREFWKTHRNPNWIFPAKRQNWKRTGLTYRQAAEHSEKPLSESGIQTAINIVAKQSGLLKKHPQVSTHTLRHSFATHMLEAGASVRQVAAVLGHSTLKQTMVYLHLTENSEEDFREKLDALED